MKACIYSSIFGEYDEIKEQPKQTVPTDFLMFTDSEYYGETWETCKRLRGGLDLSDRMAAKYYKTHPPTGYDLSIWIDGSAQILSPEFVQFIDDFMADDSICAFQHPERDCIYQEALHCFDMPKYEKQPILDQVAAYHREGYPRDYGLYACGMIARKGDQDDFDEAWWLENAEWTYQDQLSFPYVAWKLGRYPEALMINQYHNPYIKFETDKHKSEM